MSSLPPATPDSPAPAATGAFFDVSPSGRRPRTKRELRFFYTVAGASAAAMGYFAYVAEVLDIFHLYLGQCIFALSVLPAVLWTRGETRQFPTFEAFMFTFANSYAIPLLTAHVQLDAYSVDTITSAALGVILFQVGALSAFYLTKGRPRRGAFWREEVFSQEVGRYLGYGMVINTVWVYVSIYHNDLIPAGTEGPLRAIFFGIGIICTFMQSLRLGQGTLHSGEKVYFFINLGLQMAILTSTLFLINFISLFILAFAGYIVGSRRIPILSLLLSFAALSVLHNGKNVMRAKYWEGEGVGQRHEGFAGLPAFYAEWFETGSTLQQSDPDSKANRKLLERTSLFHMMCLVVDNAPERVPFLAGDTYMDIPGQFVPRFFWPGKPLGHVSTFKLSIHFGLQRAEDVTRTTIGFGAVTEAYANFGFFGLGAVGALVGFLQRLVRVWTAQSPLLSYPGIFTVLLMSWCFATEQTMSMWLASLFQGTITVLGTIMIVKRIAK